jgi:hypothetical protein
MDAAASNLLGMERCQAEVVVWIKHANPIFWNFHVAHSLASYRFEQIPVPSCEVFGVLGDITRDYRQPPAPTGANQSLLAPWRA